MLVRRSHPDSIWVSLEGMMPGNGARAYQQFGFRILNHIILPSTQCSECSVAYTVDLKEACQQMKEGEYQLPCPRNGPHTEVVRLVADARDRMPSESTNPPRVAAPLVMYPLD